MVKCLIDGIDLRPGELDAHCRFVHNGYGKYLEIFQEKIEKIEEKMRKDERNKNLNIIHDERIIKQPGPKLADVRGEQMEE